MHSAPLFNSGLGPIGISTNRGIPNRSHMIPGRTYVDILPGHTRPAFVRKRPVVDTGRPPLFLTALASVFGSSRRAYSVDRPRTMCDLLRPRYYSDSYYGRPRSSYMYGQPHYNSRYATSYGVPYDTVPLDTRQGRVATTIQQTCTSCGKFRSPSWQSRHPLRAGEIPRASICRACYENSTSSEERLPRRRRRRGHYHQGRDYIDSLDDSYSSREGRDARRRYRSVSRTFTRPRSLARRASSDGINIVIANDAGGCRSRREPLRSSSEDEVRVTRRVEYDRAERLRSRSRSSNRVLVGEIDDCYPARRRSLRRARYGDTSSSYDNFIERPRYRSRPRSLSHAHYIDDLDEPIFRRRSRSTNRVSFVEPEEEIVVSRPRGLSRRQPAFLDGQQETSEVAKYNDHDRAKEKQHIPGTASDRDSIDVETVEESDVPSHRRSSDSMLIELHAAHASEKNQSTPHSANSEHPFASLEQHPYGYDGHDEERRGLPARSTHLEEVADKTDREVVSRTSKCNSRYGANTEHTPDYEIYYSDPDDAAPHHLSFAGTAESREPSRQRRFVSQPPTPRERRDHYHKSLNDSNSDNETYGLPPTPPYRRLAHSPMTPDHPDHPDHLVYLFSSAQITPTADRSSDQHTHPRRSWRPADDTPPDTPRDDRHSTSYGHAAAGGIGHEFSKSYAQQEELRVEPETEIDYEAEGRAWMERLRREKATRD